MKNNFIFDLDGTITNTQIPFNSFVESELLRIHQNIIISPQELTSKFAGIGTKKVFKETAPSCDIDFMFRKKWEMMYRLIQEKELRCLPGMYELIVDLKKNDNQLSVASASPLLWVIACLEKAKPYDSESYFKSKLIDIFDGKYFSAESCKNNKPSPDIFFMANESFDKSGSGDYSENPPYVIGDGIGDVLAGTAANFPVLYLSSTNDEFDGHPLVTRFNSSLELIAYIKEKLMK